MKTENLSYRPSSMHVASMVDLYENGRLDLNPDFQRNSVWTTNDRKKLVESVLRGYPLPAIFLYRWEENGKPVYSVIDGKQRIESIFKFIGVIRGDRFGVKSEFSLDSKEGDEIEEIKTFIDWNYLKKIGKQSIINSYELYTIEVDGDISQIIDLFVRINSTGKSLTSAEKRHARNWNNPFLGTATKIALKYESYFKEFRIFSIGQISRMKDIELICEIMLSIHNEDLINRKIALDKIMSKGLTNSAILKLKGKTEQTFNLIKKMFPEIYKTRFIKLSDFYVLAFLISQYQSEGLVLGDKKRNQLAWDMLVEFDTGVIRVRDKQKKVEGTNESDNIYRDYHLTVSKSTDEISQRRKRKQILDSVLRTIFDKKDSKRLFSPEQRRLIWNTTEERKCKECGEPLTWTDFTIDHIKPHSKGGKTDIENASIMCRKCNSSKGNRR